MLLFATMIPTIYAILVTASKEMFSKEFESLPMSNRVPNGRSGTSIHLANKEERSLSRGTKRPSVGKISTTLLKTTKTSFSSSRSQNE